jgi:aromatic ring hydroxylase
MMTAEEYEASLRRLNLAVYRFGKRIENVVDDRMRILRLIENLSLGSAAVGYLTESMHGAGSPQAQRIMISHPVDLKGKQRKARRLCGITTDSGSGEA